MLSLTKRILVIVTLTLLLAASASGQAETRPPRADAPRAADEPPLPQQPPRAQTPPQPRADTPGPRPTEYVEEKGFKGRVFEVKHREPGAVLRAVSQLGSGFKGAAMSFSDEFKTITVRDFPENLAAIEEAIKRLDTPQPARPDIEFHVHVLIASDSATPAEEPPAELNDVIKQLKSTLKYKSYSLMTSSIQRTKESLGRVENNGVAESKLFSLERPQGNPIFYNYQITQLSLESRASGGPTIQLREFRFWMKVPLALGASNIQYENVGFGTPVGIREGEKVIVGTTTMGDKGLVIVLSARVLK